MRRLYVVIAFALLSASAWAACGVSGTIKTAASISRTDVAACYSLVSSGDTISVPAGSATYSSPITVTLAIKIVGAGKTSSNITAAAFAYAPTTGEASKTFELSGFTFIAGSPSFTAQAPDSSHPITGLKVHGNEFKNSALRAVTLTAGLEFGVFYDNDFHGSNIAISVIGGLSGLAGNFRTDAFGDANCPYFEDNTFEDGASGGFITETGQTGSLCFRHNTVTGYNGGGVGGAEVFDAHGEQGSGGWTERSEFYHNTVDLGSTPFRWLHVRGGQTIAINNTVTSSRPSPVFHHTEYQAWSGNGFCNAYPIAYNSSEAYCSPANGTTCRLTQVHNTFYANNKLNGTNQYPSFTNSDGLGSSTGNSPKTGCAALDPNDKESHYLQDAREFWKPQSGVAASLPGTCTADNSDSAYYAASDTDVIYKCTSTNTWTVYFTPYTYPHPLRSNARVPISLSGWFQ